MLKSAAITQLLSLQSVLDQIKVEDYNKPISTLKEASIGKHVRHIIEFYECLLIYSNDNTINYDNRKRRMLLEENIKYTQDYIIETIDNLEKIQGNEAITLISIYGKQISKIESSLFRELIYNIEHTVHHLAIIGIAIAENYNYITLPENFGFAESTIEYINAQHRNEH